MSELNPETADQGVTAAHAGAEEAVGALSRAPEGGSSQLPAYSRSLLKVRVPVSVTLACKKQRVEEVMTLAPGSILTFDRSCEAPIDVNVGGRTIALGEAVKVGEKFGVKIREIIQPPENFRPIAG